MICTVLAADLKIARSEIGKQSSGPQAHRPHWQGLDTLRVHDSEDDPAGGTGQDGPGRAGRPDATSRADSEGPGSRTRPGPEGRRCATSESAEDSEPTPTPPTP